ncbi:MAG: ABC transporter permease [Promethearchaeota archaeon]
MPILTRNLLKKLLRDIERSKLLFLALISLNILGVTAYISLVLGYQSLETSYEQFYNDYSFHDIEIQASEGSWINQTRLTVLGEDFKIQNPEIKEINYRVLVESGYNYSNKDGILHGAGKIVGFNTSLSMNNRIDKLFIKTGSTFLLEKSYVNKVVVNVQLANHLNITVKDRISITFLDTFKEFEVIGIAYSVEHIVVIPSRYGSSFPQTQYGIFFIPLVEVQEALGVDERVNNIIMTFNEGISSQTMNKLAQEFSKLIERELEITLHEPVPQELQISNWFLRLNVEGFREISEVLPLLILVVTTLVIFITINRLIDGQKQEIGVALSLGYYPNDLLLYYLSFVAIISAIGGGIGLFLGIIMSQIIAEVYISAISLPYAMITINPFVLIFGVFSGFLTGMIGGFIPAWRGSRMSPREAMTSYATTSPIARLVSMFSIKTHLKIPLRNIFRNPWRSSTNLLGISASVALLVISLTLLDSTSTALESEFNIVTNYDLEVSFGIPKLGEFGLFDDLSILKEMKSQYGIEAIDCVLEIPTIFYLENGKKSNEGVIMAFNSTTPSTHKFRFDSRFSHEWVNSDSSIILTSGLANYFNLDFQADKKIRITHPQLPITPIEKIMLETFFQEEGRNATLNLLKGIFQRTAQTFSFNQSETYVLQNNTLSLGGISKETWGTISYVSLKKMSELIGFGFLENMLDIDLTPVSKIFIKLSSEGKLLQSQLRNKILSELDVQSVTFSEDIKEGIMDFMTLLFALIGVMIGVSSLISVSTVFTTVFLNIQERKRELTTMQVIGMSNKEINIIFTLEILILGLLAQTIGFPVGFLTTQYLIDNLFPTMLYFEVSMLSKTFLSIIIYTVVSILLAEYPALRYLFKLELTNITKEIII